MLDYNEEEIYFETEKGIAHINSDCVNRREETVKERVVECDQSEPIPVNENRFTRCDCCQK